MGDNMSKYDFKISVGPNEALRLIKKGQDADLVQEELFDLGDGKHTCCFEGGQT